MLLRVGSLENRQRRQYFAVNHDGILSIQRRSSGEEVERGHSLYSLLYTPRFLTIYSDIYVFLIWSSIMSITHSTQLLSTVKISEVEYTLESAAVYPLFLTTLGKYINGWTQGELLMKPYYVFQWLLNISKRDVDASSSLISWSQKRHKHRCNFFPGKLQKSFAIVEFILFTMLKIFSDEIL